MHAVRELVEINLHYESNMRSHDRERNFSDFFNLNVPTQPSKTRPGRYRKNREKPHHFIE